MTEYKLQVATVDYLRGQRRVGNKVYPSVKPFPNLFVTHIYQGRSKEEGFFLKNLGVFPGVADLLCLWPDAGIGFIEMKTKDGYLSPDQKRFRDLCGFLNIKWALARSIRDAHNILKRWGLNAVHEAIEEPDLRDFEQKKLDAFNMYKPSDK